VQLEDILEEKRWRKFTKVVLFLNENAPNQRALMTQKTGLPGLQCLGHPLYTPDLAPSPYHMFSGMKKQMKAHHFSSDTEIIVALETWLDWQHSEIF